MWLVKGLLIAGVIGSWYGARQSDEAWIKALVSADIPIACRDALRDTATKDD